MKLNWKVRRNSLAALIALAAVTFGYGAPSGAAAGELMSKIQETKTISFGWAEWKPFIYKDVKTGEMTGILVELAKAFSKRLGAEAVFVQDGSWATVPAGIAAGKYQATILTITPARRTIVDFTIPIYSSDFTAIVDKASAAKSWNDLNQKGNTVAVTTGSAGDEVTSALEKKGEVKAEIVRIKDVGSAILAVATQKVGGYVNQRDVLSLIADSQNELRVLDGRFDISTGAILFKKGEPEAEAKFNEAVRSLIKDGTVSRLLAESGVKGVDTIKAE
ncbi:putative ABC-type amino acid transport substrate-binding protein [Hyphomicrobiales bacterium]|nr:putative ABC-type amino acid transport substrate-binding protein [Hyphomicrobiales bacterium]CAH1671470.1 putative ABC-type amino acid transport substrate-binding protein [Hyphomicrobiales bacterium]